MNTQEQIDNKENQRERLVDRLQSYYEKTDAIKRKIGVLDIQLRELYAKDKNERTTKKSGN